MPNSQYKKDITVHKVIKILVEKEKLFYLIMIIAVLYFMFCKQYLLVALFFILLAAYLIGLAPKEVSTKGIKFKEILEKVAESFITEKFDNKDITKLNGVINLKGTIIKNSLFAYWGSLPLIEEENYTISKDNRP